MQADKDILTRFVALQKKMDRQELYQQERDVDHGITPLNDLMASSIKETVEYIFTERQLKAALWYALSRLDEEEFVTIEEFFFLREKSETMEILGKRHGITRQAYKGRLNRILKKLCNLMKEHSGEVAELYNSLIS